jgi:hypothetical protein
MSALRVGDLEIDQDLAIERKAWTAQRVGWGLMGLIIIAGVLGLFGGGVFSKATVGAGGLTAEYERFCRRSAEQELRLEVAPEEQRGGEAVVVFDREYLEAMELVDVLPEPRASTSGADEVRLTFAAASPGAPIHVRVLSRPREVGRLHGRVGVEGGSAVELHHFTYP